MYILKRTDGDGSIAYLKRTGWQVFPQGQALDLSDVLCFTKGEARHNPVQGILEYQWYGSYRRT